MRRLCGCILLLLMTLVRSAATSGADGQGEIDRILNRFPGYHILKLQERDSETRAFVLRHFPKDNPSLVHADFDGDGHMDYAILLKDNKSGAIRLAVFLCSGDAECKTVFDEEVSTTNSSGIYIRPMQVGSHVSQTDAIDTKAHSSPARLSSAGIEVTYFGQAKVVYYWSKKHKKLESIQTGD